MTIAAPLTCVEASITRVTSSCFCLLGHHQHSYGQYSHKTECGYDSYDYESCFVHVKFSYSKIYYKRMSGTKLR